MRKLLISLLANMAGFYAASSLFPGFRLDSSWTAYALAAFIFMLFNLLVAPIVKLLLLPINLLTLGLLRWLTNVLLLYLFDLLYTGLDIHASVFPGFTSPWLAVPSFPLSLFWTLVLCSLCINLVYSVVTGLFKSE